MSSHSIPLDPAVPAQLLNGVASMARATRPMPELPHADAGPAANGASIATGDRGFDVAIGDWDDLLSAVKGRLSATAADMLAMSALATPPLGTARAHASVLECVTALDQLHTTLRHELSRRDWLEREVADAATSLARTRSELLGTQADERRARHLAFHDGLTSLPNRSFFRDRVASALAAASEPGAGVALLYFDLDNFKPINDSHGHDAGDELLKIVSARLTRAVRFSDMVCRMGGDEFACLLEGTPNRALLNHLACKLLDAVSAPARVGDLTFAVRLSIGIALSPADGAGADALIRSADCAMYRAKRHKTGYAFFDEAA